MEKPSSCFERFRSRFKPSTYLRSAYIWGYLGSACLIVGIVGDAVNRVLGLEPTSWFLLAIGCLILGVWHWLEWVQIKKEE